MFQDYETNIKIKYQKTEFFLRLSHRIGYQLESNDQLNVFQNGRSYLNILFYFIFVNRIKVKFLVEIESDSLFVLFEFHKPHREAFFKWIFDTLPHSIDFHLMYRFYYYCYCYDY